MSRLNAVITVFLIVADLIAIPSILKVERGIKIMRRLQIVTQQSPPDISHRGMSRIEVY